MALRTFSEQNDFDVLFLNNPENSWYLDDEDSYTQVLKSYIDNYQHDKVTFYGSSMSGYAAILYGIKFNADAISINPQINLDISYDFAWDGLKTSLDKVACKKIQLEKYCVNEWKDSVVYLLHGHDDIDVVNAGLLSSARSNNKKLFIHTIDSDEHVNYLARDLELFNNMMSAVKSLRRIKVDLPKTIGNKRDRRIYRNNNLIVDPLRDFSKEPIKSSSWFARRENEITGTIVKFTDVGLYKDDMSLSGAVCSFDGVKWSLISPQINDENNLLKNSCFTFEENKKKLENNKEFYNGWWARNPEDKENFFTVQSEAMLLEVSNPSSKNVYISITPVIDESLKTLLGKDGYFTFSADIATSNGSAYIQIGGVGSGGYFHKNSDVNHGQFKRLNVTEHFIDIDKSHKEAIFVRVVCATDGKEKKVKIKNPKLVFGFFPMGLNK
ncbi:TPA: hypothetical protein ACMDQF_002263 [Vibrio cholerae]